MPPKSKKIITVQPKEEKKTKGRKSKLMDQFSPEARLSEQMRQAKERYAILKPDIPASQTTVYCTCEYLYQRKWGPTIPQDEAHQHQAVGFCETCQHYISNAEKPKSNVPVVMIID